MKSTIAGCGGEHESRQITHTVRHNGQIIVIDHIPAKFSSICGDALLTPDTVRQIERILSSRQKPSSTAPIYDYASAV